MIHLPDEDLVARVVYSDQRKKVYNTPSPDKKLTELSVALHAERDRVVAPCIIQPARQREALNGPSRLAARQREISDMTQRAVFGNEEITAILESMLDDGIVIILEAARPRYV